MATTVERLAEEAMALPAQARAQLADLLVESLDSQEMGSIDQLWAAEAVRRRDEVRSGKVTTVSAAEAQQRIQRIVER